MCLCSVCVCMYVSFICCCLQRRLSACFSRNPECKLNHSTNSRESLLLKSLRNPAVDPSQPSSCPQLKQLEISPRPLEGGQERTWQEAVGINGAKTCISWEKNDKGAWWTEKWLLFLFVQKNTGCCNLLTWQCYWPGPCLLKVVFTEIKDQGGSAYIHTHTQPRSGVFFLPARSLGQAVDLWVLLLHWVSSAMWMRAFSEIFGLLKCDLPTYCIC